MRKCSSYCRNRKEVPEGVKLAERTSYVFSRVPDREYPDIGVDSRSRVPEGADLKRREVDNIIEQSTEVCRELESQQRGAVKLYHQ